MLVRSSPGVAARAPSSKPTTDTRPGTSTPCWARTEIVAAATSSLNVVTAATDASPVDTYAITASGQTSSNYAISYVPGTLTVTKAPLTVTAADKTKVYGTANPALDGTITGIKNSDGITATYATGATVSKNNFKGDLQSEKIVVSSYECDVSIYHVFGGLWQQW